MKPKPALMIIGNSNVGKSSITRLLLFNPRRFKGKAGKQPGSTLLIKPITQPEMNYQIIDLPGFGYMRGSSNRREEHIKKQIVLHVEKHYQEYFLGLVVINILRIEDELVKYFILNEKTVPLSFELISFLKEYQIPLLVIINKTDKVSTFDKKRLIQIFIDTAQEYDLKLVPSNNIHEYKESEIPILDFSALKKTNLNILKRTVTHYLKNQ